MSSPARSSRAHVWFDGLGDWRWPGTAEASADLRLPSWIPSVPPRLEPALASTAGGSAAWRAERPTSGRWLALGLLLSVLAAALLASALVNPRWAEQIGLGRGRQAEPVEPAPPAYPPDLAGAAVALTLVHADAGGSAVERARFASASLDGRGSFFIYLPAAYATSGLRYPVMYLLHGRNGHAEAFLEMGIQGSLDGLIAKRTVPPMIVVMVQDAPGLENWRDVGRRWSATYVVEVQELVDRMFRTIDTRAGRAIAGSSMGGFGAMNVALSYPLRFAVEESWLGFFDGLRYTMEGDRQLIARLGLHALLYGAEEDPIAVPSEDPEFAAELRVAGAQARGVIYPGGHSLEKIREHLDYGLAYAGRALHAAERREADEADEAARAAVASTGPARCRQEPGRPACPVVGLRVAN